jgi:hypothetical protein
VLRALARRSAAPDAAYSFTRAGRDAGWQDAAAPPPDLVYGEIGDSMTVRRGGRDGSTIDDLGVADWGETPILVGSPWAGTPTAVASLGHVYRVMLADGLDPVPVLLRVTGLEPGARVAFRWVALRGGALSTSRDLRIDPSLAASLTAELAAVARTYRGGFAGDVPAPGSELRAAWEALSQQCAISLTRIRLADLSPGFPRGIELQFDAAIQRLDPQPIVLFESRVQPTAKRVQGEVLAGGSAVATPRIAVSWLRALDTVTRQAGATWSLLAPGVIRIAPLPGAR